MFIRCKVKDKDGKIIGCVVSDGTNSSFIDKRYLKRYKYTNATITSDLKIKSVAKEIPVVFKDELFKKKSDIITLYHGSHSGISGEINAYSSRELCDFGKGFYTGDTVEQAMTIISEDTDGRLYTLSVDLSNLNVYKFSNDVAWALYVGVNRSRIDTKKYPKLKAEIDRINSHDVVVGLIADDRMAFVYSEFISGGITDVALIECLKYVKLGNQYVFKNDRACKHIDIISSRCLNDSEKKDLKHNKSVTIGGLPTVVESLRIKYRRQGKYMDEILEEYK